MGQRVASDPKIIFGKPVIVGAGEVIGAKTFIAEIGSGLVEFLAIGAAMTRTKGLAVKTPALPVHAIVRDKGTRIDGDFGFSLDRAAKCGAAERSGSSCASFSCSSSNRFENIYSILRNVVHRKFQ